MRMAGDRIVGLDIGTTKICAIVAEVEDSGQIKITGVGSSSSDGLKRGVVVNVEKTVQSIRTAIEEAEQMSGTRIEAVYAGIAGDHIRSVNTRAVVAVSGPDNEITTNDEERVIEAATRPADDHDVVGALCPGPGDCLFQVGAVRGAVAHQPVRELFLCHGGERI